MSGDPVDQLRADVAALRHDLQELGVNHATVRTKLDRIEQDVASLTPMSRYLLVEKVVYGTVVLILTSFVGALIALVVRQP
jgi:hypothetical protein